MADVIALGMENGIGELRPSKHRVVQADGTYCGEIRVGVKFTTEVSVTNHFVTKMHDLYILFRLVHYIPRPFNAFLLALVR